MLKDNYSFMGGDSGPIGGNEPTTSDNKASSVWISMTNLLAGKEEAKDPAETQPMIAPSSSSGGWFVRSNPPDSSPSSATNGGSNSGGWFGGSSSSDQSSSTSSSSSSSSSWFRSNGSGAAEPNCCAMTYPQRLCMFIMCAGGGLVMLGMSFMYIGRIFIGMPEKFALTYSMANLLILGSTCFLVGPRAQLSNMFSSHRATASAIYLLSMVGTIYTSMEVRRFMVVVPMIGIQFASLLWYVASYVPYGRNCLSWMSNSVLRKTILPF